MIFEIPVLAGLFFRKGKVMKRIIAWAAACFLLLQLAGCGEAPASEPEGAGGSKDRHGVESGEMQFSGLQNGDVIADIETSKGLIQVVLYPRYAPLAVENFCKLAEQGYYNGADFTRVVRDFMIQGGAAKEEGQDTSIWGHPFASEFSDKLHHYAGALCMAAVDGQPNTHLSQFYIVQSPQDSVTEEIAEKMRAAGFREEVIQTYMQAGGAPYLDYQATVFGQVYGGMDVVDAIANQAADENGVPKTEIKIVTITVSTYTAPEVPVSTPEVPSSLSAQPVSEGAEGVSSVIPEGETASSQLPEGESAQPVSQPAA